MRLFIASPVTLYDYTALRNDFSRILEGKWVEEENLHLTWIFLGELPTTDEMEAKMRGVTALDTSVPLVSLGTFGRPPRILYAHSDEKLLYDKARQFRQAGFDLHHFRPHATLCRIKSIHDYKRFKELKRGYREKILGEVHPEITLYRSVRTERGSSYKKITSLT